MKNLRGMIIVLGAFVVLLVSARTILFAPSWCTSMLPPSVCKPVFAAMFGGIGFACCYLMAIELKQVVGLIFKRKKDQ